MRREHVSNHLGERLSPEQVETFLRLARDAFNLSGFIVGSATHTVPDFWQLELIGHEAHLDAIRSVLNEIATTDYKGPHPPTERTGEPKCKNERMYQFVWKSACFGGKWMYVKFCMKDNRLVLLRI